MAVTEMERLEPAQRRFGIGLVLLVGIIALLAGWLAASSLGVRPWAKPIDLIGGKRMNVAATPSSLSHRGDFLIRSTVESAL